MQKKFQGCQIFVIFGCGFNDFFIKNEISKNLKQKNHLKKKIARFLYLVQVGNHK